MITKFKLVCKENHSAFFEACCHNDDGTNFKTLINITSLDGAMAHVGIGDQTIEEVVKALAGCFHPGSNASKIIKEAFGRDDTGEILFRLHINRISVDVNKATCEPKNIIESWWQNYRWMRA